MQSGYSATELFAVIHARVHGNPGAIRIEHLLTDSRKLNFPNTTCFFALKTGSGDGHRFIEELYRSGVRSFVVTELLNLDQYPQAVFAVVPSVVGALQQIAAYHRLQFKLPVIGITGSNGKTIVKEWLYHLLQEEFTIVRSPRSYNSQIGVPLSVWGIHQEHDLAIFEAGISQQDEMQPLSEVIRPTIGILTNIGEAHSEGFVDRRQKLQEKMLLFQDADILIYCSDDPMVKREMKALKLKGNQHLLAWGSDRDADIIILESEISANGRAIAIKDRGTSVEIRIPFADEVAMQNALHCYAICSALGVTERMLHRMNDLPPLSMRMAVVEGQLGSKIINDSYNADATGLLSALDFMGMQHPKMERTVVLSDLSGIGKDPSKIYVLVQEYLRSKLVKRLITVGSQIRNYFSPEANPGLIIEHYSTTEDALQHLRISSFRDQLILLKGRRDFHFERISALLEDKRHQTRLEVSLSAMIQNLSAFRSILGKDTRIMAMVKAFSYGAGSFEIANLLQYSRVDYLAVAYADEGVELRKAGIRMPIMVLNTERDAFPMLLQYDLEPEIFSLEIARSLSNFLHREGIEYFPIHVKLDTGMHRLGFNEERLNDFLSSGMLQTSFKVRSVFTHLAAAEDPRHDDFTKEQIAAFDHMCAAIRSALDYDFLRHIANTSASIRHPQATYEMVRLGIGLYGIDPSQTHGLLHEAVSLKTTIAQLNQVKRGESVGYGRDAIMKRDSVIATLRIGYADGFPRALGNGVGSVLVNGKLAKTVGNICMDLCMIDVTDFEDLTLEAEVELFGPNRSIVHVARDAGTIPYEIMTGISQRVPRVYIS